MIELPHTLHADLILCNAKIITVDRHNTLAEAVAVRDGQIIAVGRVQTQIVANRPENQGL